MSDNLRMREEHTITSGTVISGVLTGPYFSDPDSDSDSESDSDKRPPFRACHHFSTRFCILVSMKDAA